VLQRVSVICLVLLGAMVAQSDLVLIVEPGAVVFRPGRVEHPLTEAFSDGLGVIRVDLVGLRVFVHKARDADDRR